MVLVLLGVGACLSVALANAALNNSGHPVFSTWSGDGAYDCVHSDLSFYGATFRDILTLDGTYAHAPGHFADDGGAPDFTLVVANACLCSAPTASTPGTWSRPSPPPTASLPRRQAISRPAAASPRPIPLSSAPPPWCPCRESRLPGARRCG